MAVLSGGRSTGFLRLTSGPTWIFEIYSILRQRILNKTDWGCIPGQPTRRPANGVLTKNSWSVVDHEFLAPEILNFHAVSAKVNNVAVGDPPWKSTVIISAHSNSLSTISVITPSNWFSSSQLARLCNKQHVISQLACIITWSRLRARCKLHCPRCGLRCRLAWAIFQVSGDVDSRRRGYKHIHGHSMLAPDWKISARIFTLCTESLHKSFHWGQSPLPSCCSRTFHSPTPDDTRKRRGRRRRVKMCVWGRRNNFSTLVR